MLAQPIRRADYEKGPMVFDMPDVKLLTYEVKSKPFNPDALTLMVIEYKQNPSKNLFKEIYESKTIKKLLWQVIRNYGVMRFPIIIQEDIAEDCHTVVLLRSMEKYDKTRGANFGTLFTWWCMSHVRNKRNQWLRREPLLHAYSMNDRAYSADGVSIWEEVLANRTKAIDNMRSRIKKAIEENNLEGIPVLIEELVPV